MFHCCAATGNMRVVRAAVDAVVAILMCWTMSPPKLMARVLRHATQVAVREGDAESQATAT